jgi:hypothetical protein
MAQQRTSPRQRQTGVEKLRRVSMAFQGEPSGERNARGPGTAYDHQSTSQLAWEIVRGVA